MRTICIAGSRQYDLNYILKILELSGMALPKPADRDVLQDISSWHKQAIIEMSEICESLSPITSFGRVWERLASDIFVANVVSPLWGWADTNSIRFLDFWFNYEPRLNFLLICVSPEYMLATEMEGNANPLPVSDILMTWQAQQQELLRFYHRHPDRALLVNAKECIQNPSALVDLCASRWNIPLVAPIDLSPQPLVDPFVLYLARQLCQDHPQILSLANELEATLIRLVEGKPIDTAEELAPESIIAGFRRLQDRSCELRQIEAAQKEIVSLIGELEAQERLVAERQKELERVTRQLAGMTSQIEALESTRQKLATSEANLQAVASENELLRLKLHQTQEESNSIFLQNKRTQEESNALLEIKLQLTQEFDHLSSNFSTLSNAHEEMQSLVEQLHTTVAALAMERDAQTKLAVERQAVIDALTKERDAQTKLAEENKGKLKYTRDENELLLLQLHQVQEELERYFFQQQRTQKILLKYDARWKRFGHRYPDFFDYEHVSVVAEQSDETSVFSWKFLDLHIAGHDFPEFEVETFIEKDVAGFRFYHKNDNASPLLRWPVGSGNEETVTVIPVATPENGQSRLETFINLATSDWRLIQALANMLCEIGRVPNPVKGLKETQRELFFAGILKFLSITATLPAVFRYDQAEIKREQVNPNYEHLWISLNNLAFNGNHWPSFEFRLSCANICADNFGTHPKLEFPESTGPSPFESWFKESSDDFGSKLELRFALPFDMDMDVWQRLSGNDKHFLSELSKRLPGILEELQNQKVTTSRPWSDWLRLAQEVQRIIAFCTAQV